MAVRTVTCVKSTFDPPKYSQVTHVNDGVIGPSNTSTPMVRHLGGNVNPDSRFEKVPLNETEQQDWRHEIKNIASDISL